MYAHDHTIERFPDTNYQNIHFVKLGIGANNTSELKTLDTLLSDNGHSQKAINYLKVGIFDNYSGNDKMSYYKILCLG